MNHGNVHNHQYLKSTGKVLLVALAAMMMTMTALAGAPVGRIIWLKSAATGLYVSADLNRGSWAPLVADRTEVNGWEQFQVIDAGSGFIALKSVGTGAYVSADLSRDPSAPLVAGRTSAGTLEYFVWTDLGGGAFTLMAKGTERFVSADLNRDAAAPLVADRAEAGASEIFTWGSVIGDQPITNAPAGFPRLIWSDEFTGTAINTSNWTYDLGNSGWGNNELENYTNRSQNARIENGMLVIEARRESLGGSAYTSARLKTQGRRTFGVNTWVEARIQVPQGQGIWPAFWMLGSSISSIGWPYCGEIDIMEMRGQNPFVNIGTMHWSGPSNEYAYYSGSYSSAASLAAGFHVFAISRTATAIKWYVDGVQYHEGNIASGINGTSEFQAPFFLILNVAVGGNFVGSPNASTVFPQRMLVDYVRVWGQ
ncbi:MAG TPA: glycoside hydrolase family 16 protein [Blastocatellia bacterium]|nr:glycoside hydrolase family 16 protein [Blastocatellia bacterium]